MGWNLMLVREGMQAILPWIGNGYDAGAIRKLCRKRCIHVSPATCSNDGESNG